MPKSLLDRRAVLKSVGALAPVVAAARLGGIAHALAAPAVDASVPFTPAFVHDLAEQLCAETFAAPEKAAAQAFRHLSYDQYRDIRFRSDQAVWHGERLDVEVQLLSMGWLYDVPVEIWLVEDGTAKRLRADNSLFTLGPLVDQIDANGPFDFSGFRLHGPLNRADYFDEYLVFQGASYFRAVGRGQTYGLSARGLAINTARPGGEEFPRFRAFWIEKPKTGGRTTRVHALLDSASTTGAYTFEITPGEATVMDVSATLYPRRALTHVGLGPLTSMFLSAPGHHRIEDDFRPAVHDSDGLAIHNGNGECIWRPLTNPRTLQVSAFMDKDPKGFGLCQRARAFRDYEDLEARYERRPSVWIEPKGVWGPGYLELVEIPTDAEIHDNIVAYWKPANSPGPGSKFPFAYRMYWGNEIPVAWVGSRVAATRVGKGRRPGSTLFVVDFSGPAVSRQWQMPVAAIAANPGTISNVVVQANPEIDGVRVSFELDPAGTELCELRLSLKRADRQISETWLYRWTMA
jgi:periplasmic glucans biosynthesis protein